MRFSENALIVLLSLAIGLPVSLSIYAITSWVERLNRRLTNLEVWLDYLRSERKK